MSVSFRSGCVVEEYKCVVLQLHLSFTSTVLYILYTPEDLLTNPPSSVLHNAARHRFTFLISNFGIARDRQSYSIYNNCISLSSTD